MRARWVSLSLLGVLAVATAARAEHPVDAAAAQTLFERGRSAAQRGDWGQACEAFAESQRLDPGAGTLMNWAMCEAQQGQLASAWQHLTEAAQLLPPGDDRVAFVRAQRHKLAARLPYLTLRLSADMPVGAHVLRNGSELREACFGVPLPVDPGSVELLVTSPGRQTRRSQVVLHQGERLEITLEPGAALTAELASSAHPPATPSSLHTSRTQRDLGLALVATGALSAGLGLASGVVVAERKHTAEQHCPDNRCDAAGFRAAQSGDHWLVVNTLSWSLGAAAVVGGAVLLVVTPDRQREASLQLLPGGGAFVYAGSY
jgi:hypothetical protein